MQFGLDILKLFHSFCLDTKRT